MQVRSRHRALAGAVHLMECEYAVIQEKALVDSPVK